jgi:hypothetical protein
MLLIFKMNKSEKHRIKGLYQAQLVSQIPMQLAELLHHVILMEPVAAMGVPTYVDEPGLVCTQLFPIIDKFSCILKSINFKIV